MSFVYLRHEKIKGATFAASDGHNLRTTPVPHSTGGLVQRLVGRTDVPLERQVDARIALVGAKVRSNSVKAIELVLSASPEYFRPEEPDKYGHYEQDKMEQWRDAAMGWLRSRYGENLITVDLHCDESAPHLHAMITPLTHDNRLSAKETHGKPELQKNQTSYAKALEELGLQRGIPSSRKRASVKEFYKKAVGWMNRAKEAEKTVKQAEQRAEAAERRAADAEREKESLMRRLPGMIAEGVRDALPAAVVAAYKDPAKRQELMREYQSRGASGPAMER